MEVFAEIDETYVLNETYLKNTYVLNEENVQFSFVTEACDNRDMLIDDAFVLNVGTSQSMMGKDVDVKPHNKMM